MSFNIHRCQHIKVNGTQCGSPALKRNRFCFFHKRWHEQRIVMSSAKARNCRPALDLPVLEDANSIQVSVMQVMRLLLNGQLERKTAGMLLYALQIASSNLRHTSFDQTFKTRIVIDPSRVHETELGGDPWNMEDLYDDDEDEDQDQDEGKGKDGNQQDEEEDDDDDKDNDNEDEEVPDDEVEELQAALQRMPAAKHQPSAEALRREIRRSLTRLLPATRPSETAEPRSAKWPGAVVPPALSARRDIPIPARTTVETPQTTSKELLHLAEAAGIAALNPPERPRDAGNFFSFPTSPPKANIFREGS